MSGSDRPSLPAENGKTVLITGNGSRPHSLAETLRSAGHQVTVLEPADIVESPARRHIPSGIDAYLQLPGTVKLHGETLVARIRSFLTDGLLTRFELVDRLLPLLAENASILLVAGNVADGSPIPDDHAARMALLRVLAHATRAELAERDVRVAVIVDDGHDADIVHSLFHPGPATSMRDGNGQLSGREYQDWRTEMMGQITAVSV